MKIPPPHFKKRRLERGSATLIYIALMTIMLILVTAEGRTLLNLRREVKLLERRQIQRLNRSQTNSMNLQQTESHER